MPMNVDDLKKYESYTDEEIKISKFLEDRKGKAFTEEEIYEGLKKLNIPLIPDEKGSYWSWENFGLQALNFFIGFSFRWTLRRMVENGKIKMKVVKGQEYYYFE